MSSSPESKTSLSSEKIDTLRYYLGSGFNVWVYEDRGEVEQVVDELKDKTDFMVINM